MTKRMLSLLAALLLTAALFSGCGNAPAGVVENEDEEVSAPNEDRELPGEEEAPPPEIHREETVLYVGIPENLRDLSSFGRGTGYDSIIRSIYQALGERDRFGGEVQPVLMQELTELPNGSYEIILRSDIHDSLGNPITARDAAFSLATARDLGMISAVQYLQEAYAVDDYTLNITLTQRRTGALEGILTGVPIVSQPAYEDSVDGMAFTPVGTGAYQLLEARAGALVCLERSKNPWAGSGGIDAGPDRMEFYVLPDAAMAVALRAGDINLAIGMDAGQVDPFLQMEYGPEFQVDAREGAVSTVLLFNNSAYSALELETMRQAVCYAFDIQPIAEALDGQVVPNQSFGGMSASDHFTDAPEWMGEDYFHYDPELARELMDMSGYPDGLTLRLLLPHTGAHRLQTAQMLQEYFYAVNIELEIMVVEYAVFFEFAGQPDAWDIIITDVASDGTLASLAAICFDQQLYGVAVDSRFQAILDACLSADTHSPETMASYHNYLRQEALGIGLYNRCVYAVYDSRVDSAYWDGDLVVLPGRCEMADLGW